ncbi:hypothetical protein Dfri01_49170 [Dyadobacter frigoris]|nr:hypothetical protein Dfri01_49170 [Dyadobacter frigoris]
MLIRSCELHGLIFFIVLLQSCDTKKSVNKTFVIRKDQKAVGISFPLKYTEGIPPDSVFAFAEVRLLSKNKSVAILGDYSIVNQTVLFTPLIPFTHGLSYEILVKGKQIDTFEIPKNHSSRAPALLGIFPSADTLPENLLKVYLHFSHPMREGQSARYVTLLKNNSDTIKGAFLDLQPELWNPDRTILTLWLDPGRIKRDLIPNKLLGAPLKKNGSYQIVISKDWTDASGNSLSRSFTKTFTTIIRDSLSPDPDLWKISLPEKRTSNALKIDFHEPLDHSLLQETLTVKNQKGETISGKWQILDEEKVCLFSPDQNWISANYILRIETKLEDLAGNNLNRPFDKDITKKENKKKLGDFAEISFQVKD